MKRKMLVPLSAMFFTFGFTTLLYAVDIIADKKLKDVFVLSIESGTTRGFTEVLLTDKKSNLLGKVLLDETNEQKFRFIKILLASIPNLPLDVETNKDGEILYLKLKLKVDPDPDPIPNAKTIFINDVHPKMMDVNFCFKCHKTLPKFKLTGDAEVDYAVSKTKINAGNPETSLMYLKAIGKSSTTHKAIWTEGSTELANLVEWIKAEQ